MKNYSEWNSYLTALKTDPKALLLFLSHLVTMTVLYCILYINMSLPLTAVLAIMVALHTLELVIATKLFTKKNPVPLLPKFLIFQYVFFFVALWWESIVSIFGGKQNKLHNLFSKIVFKSDRYSLAHYLNHYLPLREDFKSEEEFAMHVNSLEKEEGVSDSQMNFKIGLTLVFLTASIFIVMPIMVLNGSTLEQNQYELLASIFLGVSLAKAITLLQTIIISKK